VAAYRARALVLRKTKLGETDTIVTMLSSEGRQIRAVAKGMRRPGSRFSARLEPFSVVELLLHSGRNLDMVTEAETSLSFDELRGDLDKTTAAAVVADVLDKVSTEGAVEPSLFELGVTTLGVMRTTDNVRLPGLVAAFLAKAMGMVGLKPQLATCATCGEPISAVTAFSPSAGGMLCGRCDAQAMQVSRELGGTLTYLLGARMAEVAGEDLAPELADEALRVMRVFAKEHMEARLRSLEFLADAMASGEWPHVDPPVGVG
jgi:DNA repair protein RecO (recombination protein O)